MSKISSVLVAMSLAASGLLAGCSALVYDMQQDTALNACEKIVDWNERSSCRKQHQKTYEEYEKQRKDILKKGSEK